MKKLALIALTVGLVLPGLSQNVKYVKTTPKGMVFVPQGSYKTKDIVTGYTKEISLDAFWMSNEITNAEYREFVEYVKQHQEESFSWVDLQLLAREKSEGREISKDKIVKYYKLSQILPNIIDTTNQPYPCYFANKKYDKYPVVGVSLKNARFFCMWKTMEANRILEKQGKPLVQNFRIPVEAEWEYVFAQEAPTDAMVNFLQPSKKSKPNKFGLCNISGNVSEWTSTGFGTNNAGIVRGGSWKNPGLPALRQELDENATSNYVGFRIVQSYIGDRHLSQNTEK